MFGRSPLTTPTMPIKTYLTKNCSDACWTCCGGALFLDLVQLPSAAVSPEQWCHLGAAETFLGVCRISVVELGIRSIVAIAWQLSFFPWFWWRWSWLSPIGWRIPIPASCGCWMLGWLRALDNFSGAFALTSAASVLHGERGQGLQRQQHWLASGSCVWGVIPTYNSGGVVTSIG